MILNVKMNIYFVCSPDRKVFAYGQTTRSYQERHKDTDWNKLRTYLRARGEDVILLAWYKNVNIQDHDIHKYLKNDVAGIPFPRRGEWSGYDSQMHTLESIQHLVEKEFFIDSVRKDLTLRPAQQEFLTKINSNWEQWKEFILFAKCRVGKSIMLLSHIVERRSKLNLIVARFNSPKQSWEDDIKKFQQFSNIHFINLQEERNWKEQIEYWYKTDKQIVLWSTVQGMQKKDLPYDVDLLVYDEAHVGYGSSEWVKLREKVTCPVVYISGTAYKFIEEFSDSRRFVYSYFEEQRDKKLGLIDAPSMRVIVAKYDTPEYQKLYGNDPDAMNNTFSMDDDKVKFIEPSVVADFMKIFGNQRELRPKDRLLRNATHIMSPFSSVAVCHALVEYFKGTRFAPLVVTGDTDEDAKSINKHIEENPTGSIILTRTANVLGLTASKIDTIMNCAEGSSLEFWTQFAFRGGSSNQDWDVIDMVPQRCVHSLRHAYLSACELNPAVKDYELLDYVSVTEWNNGFKELNYDDICQILSADVSNTPKLISTIPLDVTKLANVKFEEFIKPMGKELTKAYTINDNGANGKSNLKANIENKFSTQHERTDVVKKVETIKACLERFSIVIFHMIKEGNKPNDVYDIINSPHYVYDTNDKHGYVLESIKEDVISPNILSNRISQASVDIRNSMNNDICKTLEVLSTTRQSQQSVPVEYFVKMLPL